MDLRLRHRRGPVGRGPSGAARSGEARSGAAAPAARTRVVAARGAATIWPDPLRSGKAAIVEFAAPAGGARPAPVLACLTAPGGSAPNCRVLAPRVEPGGRRVYVGLRAGQVGRWAVEVRAGGVRPLPAGALDLRRTIGVVRGPVRLLATGDSEIQGIDHQLAGGLPSARVTSEAHISTGISRVQMLDWVRRAAAQAATLHPDVTAVFIGANDGFALPTPSGRIVACCAADWTQAFARRARAMMASYLRGGAGRVYWFTLPAPRDPAAAGVFRAINRAFFIAAGSFPAGVRVIDLGSVFTPGGRYRDTMVYRGRTVTVRERDGYHLSDPAGNQIAASILIGAMRADGLLGG